jgi:hypothetical protein
MGLRCWLKLSASTRAGTPIGFRSCALPNPLPSINPQIALTATYLFLTLPGSRANDPSAVGRQGQTAVSQSTDLL